MSLVEQSRLDPAESRKKELSDIIESRKRKLTELYLLHHLDRIRPLGTEDALQPIKKNLDTFLESNNLESGQKFNWEQFLRDVSFEDETVIATETIPDVEEIKEEKQDEQEQPQEDEEEEEEETKVVVPKDESNNRSAKPEVPSTVTQTSSKPVSVEMTQAQTSEQTPQPQAVQSPSIPSVTQPQQSLETAQFQLRTEPPKKKRKTPDSHISLYDANNSDAIDTTVLILKEFLPAKVAESTPLAELYYLAQTLPLVKLIPSTHKVVTTNMFESALTEGKINVVHSRIEELKRQGKWSLRQPTRFMDPIKNNKKTYWDNLLSEMSWMATDFKEERKLRIATCAYIAESISDYWKFGKVCCIKRKPLKHIETEPIDVVTEENSDEKNEIDDDKPKPVEPVVIDEEETDSIDISKLLQRPNPKDEIIPLKLPETSLEEFLEYKENSPFKMTIDTNELNPNDKTLLDNLPMFGSFQSFGDYFETAPLIPVSKVVLPTEDDSFYNFYLKDIVEESCVIPDQQKGLFGFSSQKKISTSIKPPSPPNLKYLDLRTPTIWLPEDDQDLIEYVNQFSFNWGVVSAHLSKRPTRNYSSNIERRTPWQCFERYIQLNDTFQINDMRGSNTLHAMKWLEHAHNIQATTKRRISPLGVGVESIQRGHKRLRWASMFEAVRKCMRKRESVTRPNNNQVRKQLDDKKIAAPTPAELSKLKYERDKAIQDAYLQNSNSFRSRSNPNIAGSRPVSGTAPASSNPQTQQPARVPTGNQAVPSSSSLSTAPTGLARTNSQGALVTNQTASNNLQSTSMKTTNSVPLTSNVKTNVQRPNNVPISGSNQQGANNQRIVTNAQGQKLVGPNGQPYTPEQLQQLAQIRQRKLQQHQQQNSQGGNSAINSASSSPNLSHSQINPNGATSRSNSNPVVPISQTSSPNLSQPTLPANQNKVGSPVTASSTINGNNGRKLAFVPAHVSAVISQIQSKNPNLSKAEVTKMAAQYLANLQAKQNRASQNNNGSGAVSSSSSSINNSSPAGSQQQQRSQQELRKSSPQASSTSTPPQLQQNTSTRTLTPQQKQQLDMLKALHAEQQQKRQQSTKSSTSSTGNLSNAGSPANSNSK